LLFCNPSGNYWGKDITICYDIFLLSLSQFIHYSPVTLSSVTTYSQFVINCVVNKSKIKLHSSFASYLLMYSFILLCILFALVFTILLRISFLCVTCCVCSFVLFVLVYFSMCFFVCLFLSFFLPFFLSFFLLFLFCYILSFFLLLYFPLVAFTLRAQIRS